MAPTPDKSGSGTKGQQGEWLARQYLEDKSYRFVAANWTCSLGEIDLIMQDGLTRVIVEVRLRTNSDYGTGSDTIDYRKQQKIIRATKMYLQQKDYWQDLRFDVISITLDGQQQAQIEHIKHAFENTNI